MKQYWVYVLNGGEPFSISIPNNPTFDHNGSMSVWSMYLSPFEKKGVESLFRQRGQNFLIYDNSLTEEESSLRLIERDREQIFKCEKCPTCWWFDHAFSNRCGVEDLQEDLIESLIRDSNSQSSKDYLSCPIFNKE